MTRYKFPELIKSHPHAMERAMESGTLSTCHMFIELPDDFDFQGDPPKPAIRGVGDVVAIFTKPIAGVIDKAIGTNLANCGGCKKRQEALNKLLPS